MVRGAVSCLAHSMRVIIHDTLSDGKFLWNVFSQTRTAGLKPVALPEARGRAGTLTHQLG